MKKILLLLCILAGTRVFAQTGNLVISTEQGEKIWVFLNGAKQNPTPQSNIKITGLSSPDYELKVIFQDTTIPAMDKTVYLSMPDIGQAGEYTYSIKKKGDGKYTLRSKGAAPMAEAAPPADGQVVITYSASQSATTIASTGNAGASATGAAAQPLSYVPGYTGPIGCPTPMNKASFDSVKTAIGNLSFESSKSDMAKSVMNNHCFTTDEVIQILNLFDLENTKLEIAKYAYPHTYDKGNYSSVNNVFTFETNKTALSNFIGSH